MSMKFHLQLMLPVSLGSYLLQLVFYNHLFCPRYLFSTTSTYYTVPTFHWIPVRIHIKLLKISHSLLIHPYISNIFKVNPDTFWPNLNSASVLHQQSHYPFVSAWCTEASFYADLRFFSIYCSLNYPCSPATDTPHLLDALLVYLPVVWDCVPLNDSLQNIALTYFDIMSAN